MVCFGTVKNGMVILKGKPKMRDGTKVRVEVVEDAPTRKGAKPAFRLSDLAIPMGVTDLAAEHDHYLYGAPKRTAAKVRRAPRKRGGKSRKA